MSGRISRALVTFCAASIVAASLAASGAANAQVAAIVGWGYNGQGQASPPPGDDFVAIAAGNDHSLALRQDGSIVAWGSNLYGQASAPSGNDYVAIAAGGFYSLALKQDGSIVAWGIASTMVHPPAGNDYVAIAAGGDVAIALREDGSIKQWGSWDELYPLTTDFTAIAAGFRHGLALRQDGSVVGWGNDAYGQATPPPAHDYTAIAAREMFSLALRQDGSIVGWGYNGQGQASPPPGNGYVAIAAGLHFGLALRDDGSIVGWGEDDYGKASPPAGTGHTAIAAGGSHSLALAALVDTTSPTLTDVPADIAAEATSAAGVTVTYTPPTATDAVDGTVPVTCTPASGTTLPLGVTTVTCTATDTAGNASTRTFSATVSYTWSGVLQPVNADGSSIFNLGRTVPVKFRLAGSSTGITTAEVRLWYARVNDGVEGTVVEAETKVAATEGNEFRYDVASSQYVFNWSTKGLERGTYALHIDLGDTVSRIVEVALQ